MSDEVSTLGRGAVVVEPVKNKTRKKRIYVLQRERFIHIKLENTIH